MADLCAEGPVPVRGRPALEAGRGVGARHPGPRERQAQGLLVLHARAHRRHAQRARRPGLDQAHAPSATRCCGQIMHDQLRRAVLAFPDEDVLVGTRFANAVGLRGVPGPQRHRPPPRPRGHAARSGPGAGAWPSASASTAAPTTTAPSRPRATATRPEVFDHDSLKPEAIPADVAAFFEGVDAKRGRLPWSAFGWAMAEDLAKLAVGPEVRWSSPTPSAAGAWCGPSRPTPSTPTPSTASSTLARGAPRRPATRQGVRFLVLDGPEQSGRLLGHRPCRPSAGRASPGPACWSPRCSSWCSCDPAAYVERYAEPDKAATGLGRAWARGRCRTGGSTPAWRSSTCCWARSTPASAPACSACSTTRRGARGPWRPGRLAGGGHRRPGPPGTEPTGPLGGPRPHPSG